MTRSITLKTAKQKLTDAERYDACLALFPSLEGLSVMLRRNGDPTETFPDLSVLGDAIGSYERLLTFVRLGHWKGGRETFSWHLRSGARYEASGHFELRPESLADAPESHDASDVGQDIVRECDALKELLLRKNRAYGNSALNPVRVFSRASVQEQLLVRLDDKLSRLARGSDAGEDTIQDILGYLILLRIQQKRSS